MYAAGSGRVRGDGGRDKVRVEDEADEGKEPR